jgi:heat shock protein HslJ
MRKLKVLKSCFILLITIQLFTCCSTSSILTQVVGKEFIVTTIKENILEASKLENGLPRMTFGENGILTGFTGCNTFNGSHKLESNLLYLEPGSITKMMCYDLTEMDFLNALKEITRWKLEGNNLYLLNDEKPVMTLFLTGK